MSDRQSNAEAQPGPAQQIAPLIQAVEWADKGIESAIGTVVQTWGSAPQKAGSLIAVNRDGDFQGSVSGGCVESSVIDAALLALRDGNSRLLHFTVAEDTAWSVGLACGGKIDVRVEPLRDDDRNLLPLFRRVRAATATRHPLVVATRLRDGLHQLIDLRGPLSTPLEQHALQASRQDASTIVELDGERTFLHVFNPPCRLILLGAVHIAQVAAPIARLAGFEVAVVDHRQAFATRDRFPATQVVLRRPEEAIAELGLDERTAVVALTHNPEIDDPALARALHSNAFYVGALGSRKSHEARIQRLRAIGLSDSQIGAIHAPAGLNIGASGPAEIAISIVAEVVETFRRGPRARPAAS